MAWTTPGTATAGSVLTAAFWNTQVRDNTNALYGTIRRIAYQERTTDYTSTATTIASATNVFSSNVTFTADGTSKYLVEFYCPRYLTSTTADAGFGLHLTDGGNNGLGLLSSIGVANGDSARTSVLARVYYLFSAGAISINLRGVIGAGTGTINAGSGGATTASYFPAYLAVYGPPLT
jgi:hypothetical protein